MGSVPDSGSPPVVVNPITNRIYVPNLLGRNVTVIDGATNSTTTVGADAYPFAAVVNPITNRVYVANAGSNNVTVITDAPTEDTKVRHLTTCQVIRPRWRSRR